MRESAIFCAARSAICMDAGASTPAGSALPSLPWPSRLRHPSSKWNHAGVTPAGSTTFKVPDDVRVACLSVKQVAVVRIHVGELFPVRTTSVLRPHGVKAAHLVFIQKISEHYRVRVPFSKGPIVQKQNGRLTSGKPWSITTSGDHFIKLKAFGLRRSFAAFGSSPQPLESTQTPQNSSFVIRHSPRIPSVAQ